MLKQIVIIMKSSACPPNKSVSSYLCDVERLSVDEEEKKVLREGVAVLPQEER